MSDPKSPRSLTALAVEESVHRCLAGGHWRNYSGPSLEMLTDWFRSNLRHPYVRFCSSGTIGVELALRSLHLQPGDEVLLCGYDYPGNFRVIEDCHAKVVLCKPSKSQIWSPDIESFEQSVAPATRAIIVSHLHGELASMDRIVPWARDRGIVVIEDACQAIGGTLQNRPVGSWGDLSVFSFGGSKLVSAGRGGVVLTSNPLLAQRMTRYSDKETMRLPFRNCKQRRWYLNAKGCRTIIPSALAMQRNSSEKFLSSSGFERQVPTRIQTRLPITNWVCFATSTPSRWTGKAFFGPGKSEALW